MWLFSPGGLIDFMPDNRFFLPTLRCDSDYFVSSFQKI
jgi:hypothetical protein